TPCLPLPAGRWLKWDGDFGLGTPAGVCGHLRETMKGHGEKLSRKQEQAIVALLEQPTVKKAVAVIGSLPLRTQGPRRSGYLMPASWLSRRPTVACRCSLRA